MNLHVFCISYRVQEEKGIGLTTCFSFLPVWFTAPLVSKEKKHRHNIRWLRPLTKIKNSRNFLQSKWMTDYVRVKWYQSYLVCFVCKISDASLPRLYSIMLPWGSLFQILQFPRCIQDLYIVSLLFQAVSADCFLFKHKSHLLTPNCRVCLFQQISPPQLHLLKLRITHI